MPTLLELQRAVMRSLAGADPDAAAGFIRGDDGFTPQERLSVYRNTFLGVLTKALCLAYPVVHRLVGAAFFESAAQIFIERRPPDSAYLNQYGEGFPGFLEQFLPAASLAYLSDVARVELAVSRALHALDISPLAIDALSALPASLQARVVFTPHPSLGLVHVNYPADRIWQAVVDGSDAAFAGLDASRAPAWLIVDRTACDVQVTRVTRPEWECTELLARGIPLDEALGRADEADAAALLAEHFARGRFTGFAIAGDSGPVSPS